MAYGGRERRMNIVIGLGKTGLSCVDYFCKRQQPVMVMDTREHPPNADTLRSNYPQVTLLSGALPTHVLCEADQLIISPGVSLKTPAIAAAIAAGVPCIGDIELFVREAKAPIIAITASNGKTTVTTLVGELLKNAGFRVEVCGNIGTPVLDTLHRELPDYYVLELSSFQLETTTSLKAKIAVVLNISADHMDRYDTVADYALAKRRIYQHSDIAICNADEPLCWQDIMPRYQVMFSASSMPGSDFYTKDYEGQLFIYHQDTPWFAVAKLPLQGLHNVQNTLVALAIGYSVGLTSDQMLYTLKHFKGLPHRCQKIASHNGIDWYNDSKGTNIGAVIAALKSLGPRYKKIVLIAGGDAKGADLTELKPMVCQYVSHLIVMGKDADQFEQVFRGCMSCQRVANLTEAVQEACQAATSGDAVLLSPACSSLDMFKNYEERGMLFIKVVKEFLAIN